MNFEKYAELMKKIKAIDNVFSLTESSVDYLNEKLKSDFDYGLLKKYVDHFFEDLKNIYMYRTEYLNIMDNNYLGAYSYVKSIYNNISEHERKLYNNIDNNNLINFFKCYVLQMIWLSNSSYALNISHDELMSKIENPINDGIKDDRTIFYRGQNDYSFGLIPSYYRTLTSDAVIDINDINMSYNKAGLDKKYLEVFDKNVLDYDFYSIMQHSISYSPLLDFSKSLGIATMFAISNNNPDSYYTKDRAVYALNVLNNSVIKHEECPSFNIDFHKKKLTLKSTIFGKPIYLCTSSDFNCSLTIYNKITNDRMRVQKGVFLCLTRGIIVNGNILWQTKDFNLVKYKISNKSVSKIREAIVNYKNNYDIEYLMDPYLYFNHFYK